MTAIGLGLAGALAGVPAAAVAYAVPSHGRLRIPKRWWRGAPARPTAVAATALLAGAAAAIVGAVVPPSPVLPAFWIFAVVGVALAVTDLRRRRLPYGLTGILGASSVGCFTVSVAISGDVVPFVRALTMGFATMAALFLVALALPGQLGLGDVTFAGAATLSLGWLSWEAAATGLLAGLLFQSTLAIILKVQRRASGAMPMGPALLAGWLLGVVLAA